MTNGDRDVLYQGGPTRQLASRAADAAVIHICVCMRETSLFWTRILNLSCPGSIQSRGACSGRIPSTRTRRPGDRGGA